MSVAVLASSGGGAATLGHTDPAELLTAIHNELRRIQFSSRNSSSSKENGGGDSNHSCTGIRYALFVLLHGGKGLDGVDVNSATATLYTVGCENETVKTTIYPHEHLSSSASLLHVQAIFEGPLIKVNELIQRLDSQFIAPSISRGEIKGIISISSDPLGVNRASFRAAASNNIPVTGSGGTSLSAAAAVLGVKLVGNAGGSVATTTRTRALSYTYALASAWKGASYNPMSGGGDAAEEGGPHMRSVLEACLPAFIAACLSIRFLEFMSQLAINDNLGLDLSQLSGLFVSSADEGDNDWISRLLWQLRYQALPTVCCIVAATSYAPGHGSTVIMSAGVASSACSGSILGGLAAGWLVSCLVDRALFACIRLGVPATMTNILVAGCVGSVVALVFAVTRIVPTFIMVTDAIRCIVRMSSANMASHLSRWDTLSQWDGSGIGFFTGCVFCYGSKIGWYHSIFLPLILIEMERGEPSILGAVDECTLVLISAGVCAANLLIRLGRRVEADGNSPSNASDQDPSILRRGLRINLLCGDFIEVAYPYMERSVIVNASCYLGSGLATEILYQEDPELVLSSAYLPLPISIWLSKDWQRMGVACLVAFGISFIGTLTANIFQRPRCDVKKDE